RELLPYCESSLRKTQEIVEKTFEVACEKLQNSKAARQYQRAREAAINASYQMIEAKWLDGLGDINDDTIKRYMSWKFPKRDSGIAADSTATSDLLRELRDAEIQTYRALDKAIDDNIEWFLDYELKHPPFAAINWSKPNEER